MIDEWYKPDEVTFEDLWEMGWDGDVSKWRDARKKEMPLSYITFHTNEMFVNDLSRSIKLTKSTIY